MKTLKFNSIAICLLGGSMFLNGCTDSSDYDFEQSNAEAQGNYDAHNVVATFDPTTGQIPPTNNLLFSGSTDGTLNIPVLPTDSDAAASLKGALNSLDGFSTVNPITTAFGAALDPASIVPGDSVRVFALKDDNSFDSEVTSFIGTITGADNSTLVLLPTTPLKGSTNHVVIITNKVKTSAGNAVVADTTYNASKGTTSLVGSDFEPLEPVRIITNANEAIATSQGVDPADIVLSWSFKTQSIGAALQSVYDNSTAGTFVSIPALATDPDTGELVLNPETNSPIQLTTKAFLDPDGTNPQIVGKADVHLGALTVPYYLNEGTGAQDFAPLTGSFVTEAGAAPTSFNPVAVKKSDVTIPALITVPNSASAGGGTAPTDGFPVVIFQHGITANRTSLLPIANALADAGFVGVAIDLALHGVGPDSPIHASNTPFEDKELTFDLDVADNQTGAPAPTGDGQADDSGTHFINLTNLPTSRGNVRQSVADLFVLRKSLAGIASADPAFPTISMDSSKVRFIGHSLGGIVGTTFLAFDDTVGAATLAMPGGGIAQLLNNSVRFGPRIEAGLAAAGINKGTADFDSFMAAAQWIFDSADPINHAAKTGATHSVHMIEVVGIEGNAGSSDQVIPNSVATAPLSGTEPLARVMGLSGVSAPGGSGGGLVRFTAGDHSSILIPSAADTLDVTIEMQTQTATFMATNGASLPVANAAVTQ